MMSENQDDRYQRITLRIPRELHGYLMREAEARTRSMNAEIIDRLESSFRDEFGRSPVEVLEVVKQFRDTQQELKQAVDKIEAATVKHAAENREFWRKIASLEAGLKREAS